MKHKKNIFHILLLISSTINASENPFILCEQRLIKSDYSSANSCFERMLPAVNASEAYRTRALVNWGESLLGEGNYIEGWQNRDARLNAYPIKLARPWDGSNPSGKTILVRCEGGLGDTFFFARYVALLNAFGARVVLLVQGPLKSIMQLSPINAIVMTGKDFESNPIAFDYDVYMMSLPRYLAHNINRNEFLLQSTTLETIPTIGKYMAADANLVAQWKSKFPTNKFKIGICWKASPLPGGVTRMLERDIPLSLLVKIGSIPNVALYNLLSGYDEPVRQSCATQKSDAKNIIPDDAPIITSFTNFDKAAGAFMDTSPVIENMDLIISVDTAVPNLAGALYKPVWVLLPYESDWRWGNGQMQTSPWHPTARLFWQPDQGNWGPVVDEVVAALQQKVQERF